MKPKKKTKPKSPRVPAARLPKGMQKTREVSRSSLGKDAPDETFTPMQTGRPDTDRVPGVENPAGAQGGLGPLNQEGEGELQNDQLAALEEIEPG